jgi:Tfp pilus assembly protein PilF
MRDRAEFYARGATAADRERIARTYGVRLAVFRKRLIADGSERSWLWRATAEGFLLDGVRTGSRQWTRAKVRAAVPADWRIVFDNHDFLVVRTPFAAAERAPAMPQRSGVWLDAFEVDAPATRDDPLPVLASAVGFPAARVALAPVPLALGMTDRPVWSTGGLIWEDGPDEVTVALDLANECVVRAVEVVPFLRTERREVFEIRALGAHGRFRAFDGESIRMEVPARAATAAAVEVRSMMGEPFGLWDVRVLGNPESCVEPFAPPARPHIADADVADAELLRLAMRYPNDARAALGIARKLAAKQARGDAMAVLRSALSRDPGASPAWVELGLMLDAEGRLEEARAAYERGRGADSNSAWARGCIAWVELRSSHPVRALYHAWRATRLDARYSDAFTIMASAARRLGLGGWASTLLRRAIRLDPQRSWPYLELAQMHVDGGDRPAALEVLGDLLALVPDDTKARAMMAGLQGGAAAAPAS